MQNERLFVADRRLKGKARKETPSPKASKASGRPSWLKTFAAGAAVGAGLAIGRCCFADSMELHRI